VLRDQRIDHRTGLEVSGMAVVALESGAVLEVAGEREIDRAPAAREAAPDLDAQQAGNPAALRLEGGTQGFETLAPPGLQAPKNDVTDHETRIVAG
jgi:hypothetical protein